MDKPEPQSSNDNQEHAGLEKGMVSAQRLLARAPDQKYIGEWTKLIGQKKDESTEKVEISVIIFRLGTKWLAIPATVFSEIYRNFRIHTIPQRSNSILLGIVNFRGQLALCVNMQKVLGIESIPSNHESEEKTHLQIMMAIQKEKELWVFRAAELFGIFHCDAASVQNVPPQVLKLKNNCLRGFIKWNEKQVGLLDEELLFAKLRVGTI